MKDFSLVIPFYNEEHNIELVLSSLSQELKKHNIDYELVAVDNGSRDKTNKLICNLTKKDPRIRLVTVDKNKGYGFGIVSGLKTTTGQVVGFMDGDGQISPNSLYACYAALKENPRLHLTKTFRVNRKDGLRRGFLSLSFNQLLQILFNINSKDINSCPKLMKRECYEKIRPSSKDWFIDSEILIRAKQFRYTIKEIPARFNQRKKGKSNVYWKTLFEFINNLIMWRITLFFEKQRAEKYGKT
ncbi:glycosyltransferase [Candidatus Woesearchaeota archaeon]|nr:glycosyltransferase [Candidatus Woesearchaeota archaeon]